MREIKFRFFDRQKNYMAYAGPETGLTDGDLLDYGMKAGYPVMQFTGLRDKNGVKIYEGDAIHLQWIHNYTGSIEFRHGTFCMVSAEKEIIVRTLGELYAHNISVIGNIHQHPHLLEQKK